MYVYSFHWVLIILSPDRGAVHVLDSLRKPKEKYQNIIDMFTRCYIFFTN